MGDAAPFRHGAPTVEMLVAAFHRGASMWRKKGGENPEKSKRSRAPGLEREAGFGALLPVLHEAQFHGLSLDFKRCIQ